MFRKHAYSVKTVVSACAPSLRRHFYFPAGLCLQTDRWIKESTSHMDEQLSKNNALKSFTSEEINDTIVWAP